MSRLQVVQGDLRRSLNREGQLTSLSDDTVKQYVSTALCGIACCTDDLVLDDLNNMEAKSALDQLLVALWSRDAWNGDTA